MGKGTIYIIRHGMTEANKQKNFQGIRDIPLNDEGRSQARAMAEHFRDIPIDAIYASPLLRAHQTAQALATVKGLTVQDVQDLREIHFGIWEGMDYDVVRERWPEEFRKFLTCPTQCHPEGGELFEDAAVRVRRALEKIMGTHGNDAQIALVMHGGTGRLLLCDFLGIPIDNMWKISLVNCSVTTFNNWDGNMVLDCINDHHFLPDGGDFLKNFLVKPKE